MTIKEQLGRGLSGRYTLERELGEGGMAVVFLAHDLRHDRPVALKVLKPEISAEVGAERFLREIKLAARLTHPHILPVYDSGEAEGLLFYVMPNMEGQSLRERLDRERQLPLELALRVARDVASALDYAHRQHVLHRDVKPENILFNEGNVMLADFGIGKALSGGKSITQTGMFVGTPSYISPEQAAGETSLDGRTDLYSLGCVLYEMLAGEPPFTGATAQIIISKRFASPIPKVRAARDVPEAIDEAVTRALARTPADRFSSAADFIDALTVSRDSAKGTGATPPDSPKAPSRPKAIAVLAARQHERRSGERVFQRWDDGRDNQRACKGAWFARRLPELVFFFQGQDGGYIEKSVRSSASRQWSKEACARSETASASPLSLSA